MSHMSDANLTRDTFSTIRLQLEEFFTGLAGRMGDRFAGKEYRKDSMLLTAPGWQALGVVFNDVHFRLKLGGQERSSIMDRIAGIDWSRFNADWFNLGLGQQEIDKKTGEPVLDSLGRPRLALTGAGRSNTQAIIDYVRDRAGYRTQLEEKMPANDPPLEASLLPA